MVATPERFTSGLTIKVSFIHHASNTLLIIYNTSAVPLMFAVTACGHHLRLATMVFLAASRSSQTLDTIFLTTINSVVLIK